MQHDMSIKPLVNDTSNVVVTMVYQLKLCCCLSIHCLSDHFKSQIVFNPFFVDIAGQAVHAFIACYCI